MLGTVGYMSPEQALGEPLDFRSDQFSFGSILYEMATGKRAFARASAPETMAAIIREEPVPLASAAPVTPVPLRWIVERCHAKDPEERYASTKDLARDLARLRESLSEGSASGGAIAAPAARRRARQNRDGGGRGRRAGGRGDPRRPRDEEARRRCRRSGARSRSVAARSAGPASAPDGKTVVYAAAWQGGPPRLYTTRVDSRESTALPLPDANVASVSGKGMLALVLPRKPAGVVAEVSLAGGAPRELADGAWLSLPFAPPIADWAPGG